MFISDSRPFVHPPPRLQYAHLTAKWIPRFMGTRENSLSYHYSTTSRAIPGLKTVMQQVDRAVHCKSTPFLQRNLSVATLTTFIRPHPPAHRMISILRPSVPQKPRRQPAKRNTKSRRSLRPALPWSMVSRISPHMQSHLVHFRESRSASPSRSSRTRRMNVSSPRRPVCTYACQPCIAC